MHNAHRWRNGAPPGGSTEDLAVHLAERVADQLEPGAVRVREVNRRAVDVRVRDASRIQLALQVLPAGGLDGDRQVMQAAQHLGVRAEIEAWEVEERERVAVADVEE